jgi:hypothetical protein
MKVGGFTQCGQTPDFSKDYKNQLSIGVALVIACDKNRVLTGLGGIQAPLLRIYRININHHQ